MMSDKPACFYPFLNTVTGIELPDRFTFPFYYDPHPLSVLAAEELQQRLSEMTDLNHNFGLDDSRSGMIIGKMFGVLVVETKEGELGYLSAFSGKLANSNHHEGFVPPVFDILDKDGFFLKEEDQLNALNREVERLSTDPEYMRMKISLKEAEHSLEDGLNSFKRMMKQKKRERDEKRVVSRTILSGEDYLDLEEALKQESLQYQWELKRMKKEGGEELTGLKTQIGLFEKKINDLKAERKERSSKLQQKLFKQYSFLNGLGKTSDLGEVFKVTSNDPPAGAGECAAPKLLQYAFLHDLKPVSMAEFWWGASPKSEVRKHRNYYPACRGKCEPILGFMLQGLKTDPNPMEAAADKEKDISIIFEDDDLIVLSKPAEMLSVPGKKQDYSVYSRLLELYPEATGPLLVHRLDMSTSGLMLAAKRKEIHKKLQSQFLNRTVEKRYVALVERSDLTGEGTIDLPLRVDLDDRPRQLVCGKYGKAALTKWKVLGKVGDNTLVQFWPMTGRTHQLRVHSAHVNGLNSPIVGDDLYGTRSKRLYLHAEYIEFQHPVTGKRICFFLPEDFSK